jgi:hypothetical protein
LGDETVADLEDPKIGVGGEEDNLSPIELFRRRARRMLLVGEGVILESASGGCGESKEILPEIEMSVLSSRIPAAQPASGREWSFEMELVDDNNVFGSGTALHHSNQRMSAPSFMTNVAPQRTLSSADRAVALASFMANAAPQRTLSSADRAVALAQLQERRRTSGARGPLAPIAPSMGDDRSRSNSDDRPTIRGSQSSLLRMNLASSVGTRLPSLATSTAQQRRRRSTIREEDTLVREDF